MRVSLKYIHQEITEQDVLDAARYVDATPLIDLLKYWRQCRVAGIEKTNIHLHHPRQYNHIGNSMAKICRNRDLTRLATMMLRHAICEGADVSNYERDFLQGVEHMLDHKKAFTRKQSWQLAMLLTDYLEF